MMYIRRFHDRANVTHVVQKIMYAVRDKQG
jgi:hypothetical protein